MKRKEFARLMPCEALKRSKSAPTIVVIGPSTSGKSTLIYALVNHRIIGFIKVGIGDKSQTTIIPCNFVFDERIEKDEYFAMRIRIKDFSAKDVHIEILEQLAKLFTSNEMCAEDTLDSIDDDWFQNILEPEDTAYHLGKIKEKISVEEFKESIAAALDTIENAEPSFSERVKAKKKELAQQKVKISEIRKMVFEDIWVTIEDDLLDRYFKWLNSIGVQITNDLNNLLSAGNALGNICEYSANENDVFTYGGTILKTLFDPFEPFSLIVEDITLACRPRAEIIARSEENIPLRFCLRDTMGLTQIGMDGNSIKDALDIALNCSPDSILLLMNLEERDDIITESCTAIEEKLFKAAKLDVPVNVIFTKADRIIGNLINKADKDTVVLKQDDYDANILCAIDAMEKLIKGYLTKFPQGNVTWLSLRYLEESIDPIQLALKNQGSDRLVRFTPDGLYQNIDGIIRETQRRILPAGITTPLFVTAIDADAPAVEMKLAGKLISSIFNSIQLTLTEDKATVNGYTITTKYTLSGRSVVAYYNKLQRGQGHTTRANVYGNFSINMKAMLNNILCNKIPEFLTLYESQAISTVVDNLADTEVEHLVEEFDKNQQYRELAFSDINPALVNKWSDKQRNTQILHLALRDYFGSSEKFNMVMDKVAFNLSYGNKRIRRTIDKVYQKPISYDQTMREMQETFKKIFASQAFADIITEEIGKAMTDLVNKMIIII
jgi:GTP-binding protein EngB required for normal cell division